MRCSNGLKSTCQSATSFERNGRAIVWFRWSSRRNGRIFIHQGVKNKPKSAAAASTITKEIAFNKYQIEQRDKYLQDQDIYPPGTCVIMRDSILNELTEVNLYKQYNVRIRKFPGAAMDDLNHHVHSTLRKKLKHHYSHMMPPIQHLRKFQTSFWNWRLFLKKHYLKQV